MAKFTIKKNKNFTVMSNYHLQNKYMTLKAKGLLSVMLSLPENWDYSIKGLVSIGVENETAIRSTLKELEKFKHLKVNKLLPNETKSGRIEYEYYIYEIPYDLCEQERTEQGTEILYVEKQGLGKQDIGNHVQLSTKELSTKELSTKKERIDIYNNIPPISPIGETQKPRVEKSNQIFQQIIDSYNGICVSLPKAVMLSEKRKKAIKKMCDNGYTLETFMEIFTLAEHSDFLSGKKTDWKASLDWLVTESNAVKVLNNNYANVNKNDNKPKEKVYRQATIDDLEDMFR